MTMGKYWYDHQIKRYVSQFAAIFQEMYVSVGKNASRDAGLINVPIIVGSLDRVAASAATGHTQNRMIRLPLMSVHVNGYEIRNDRMKGSGVVGRDTYVPLGGTLPQDGVVVTQRMAVPYNLTVNLHVYASNEDQLYQILEQIFVLFNPSLSIQTSDAAFDKARITDVELLNISNEDNFPPGTESGNISVTLTFKIEANMTIPADVHKNLVQKIIMRVSAVDDPNVGTIFSSGSNNAGLGDLYDQMEVPQMITDVSNLPPLT